MRFGSVCSGIEAASVAWTPLGWEAAWFSEIEPFPCSVLAHHFPTAPNYGDMTTLPERIRNGEVEAPDVFCGGTPCQAFSVAGKRQSLDDARGNLSLIFCEVANAIDNVRRDRECIIFWENVPGVLNTKDNAFGCFLAGLAGEDEPLQPSGKRWPDAGCVLGPQRAVAWRVLDAQYFGLAQRRKRVFVVASARDDFDPAAVLFEFDGLRRDSAPSRQAGQEVADDAGAGTAGGSWWDGGQVSQTLDAVLHKGQTMPEKNRFPAVLQSVAHTLRAEGFDASEDGAGRRWCWWPSLPTCLPRSAPTATASALNARTQETNAGKILRTLREAIGEEAFAQWGLGILDSLQSPEILRKALHGVSIRPAAFSRSWVVYCALSRKEDGSGWLLQSLRETGCDGCPPQGWEPSEQLAGELGAYLSELSQPGAQASRFMRDLWWAAQGSGVLREALSAVQEVGRSFGRKGQPIHTSEEGSGAAGAENLQDSGLHREVPRERILQQACAAGETRNLGDAAAEQIGGRTGPMAQAMMVRRLTCEEAEFLQGFPRGYTAIPWRKKPASECPDGPRYKSLGNSWAVPVVRWIGRRIEYSLAGII